MDAIEKTTITLAIINFMMSQALALYNSLEQGSGNTPIPTWDEITSTNKITEIKIDSAV